MKKFLQRIKNLTRFFKKIPPFLRKHYFFVLLSVLIIFVAWGAYIFWQLGMKTVSQEPELPPQSPKLSEDIFQKVSQSIERRSTSLPLILNESYPDIFR